MLGGVQAVGWRVAKASRLLLCTGRTCSVSGGCTLNAHGLIPLRAQSTGSASSQRARSMSQQIFDFFLVIDFEATCEEVGKIQPVQEIIEFPVIQIDAKTFDEAARFHHYVHPTERPVLTSFCTNLTGILQETVDKSSHLDKVLSDFHDWLVTRKLVSVDGATKLCPWTFVTCGDWDLGIQLPQEADFRKIELPRYFGEWINLKKAFSGAKGRFPNSLSVMLRALHIEPVGRLHSGIDDVRNMCTILKTLAQGGYVLQNTPAPSRNPFTKRLPKFGPGQWRRRDDLNSERIG